MKYLVALREPTLSTLWVSQVFSALGDQLYMLAAMWIAVERFGSDAAYVAASIGIARIVFGLAGGLIADRFDRRWVMIIADIARFAAVAPLPIIAHFGIIQFWHLMLAGVVVGAFGSFFDPALQSSLPSITKSRSALEAMTGLIDLTQRLARAIGPSLTGLLVAFLPISQFFTIQAVSFLISAATILILGSRLQWQKEQTLVAPFNGFQVFFRDINDGFTYVAKSPALAYCLLNLLFLAGLWGMAFTVGVPILVKHSFADNVANYGYLVGAYGVGSVLGNVLSANFHLRSSWFNVFAGDVICGLGFVLMALTDNFVLAACAAAVAAMGGATADLLLLNVLMAEVPANVLGKTLSLRITVLGGGHALGLVAAAPMYNWFEPTPIIVWCGILMAIPSAYGAIRYGLMRQPEVVNAAEATDKDAAAV